MDIIRGTVTEAAGAIVPVVKSPDEAMGELFHDVQRRNIYNDGKVFADVVPRKRMEQIYKEYTLEKSDPTFDIKEFLNRHFHALERNEQTYVANKSLTIREHITELWDVLERRHRKSEGSLIALPYPYVVPGGRFNEQFYWDGYFIMRGLAADGRWDRVEWMMKNYAYMLRRFGRIPTANRTYFLSRSQPPFFSHMVVLLAQHKGRRVLAEYLPYLLLEHRFWMKGQTSLGETEHKAYRRVVELPNGLLVNRYYDDKTTPRPESLREDMTTADGAAHRDPKRLYLHLRAAAESGWDFSSRWFEDPADIRTIHTADIVPVDLNSLLYHLEKTIADAYAVKKNLDLSRRYAKYAQKRSRAILGYCWDDAKQFFVDYNFHKQAPSARLSLAAVFPLYVKIATSRQAAAVARRIEKTFLKSGGLITTIVNNGQQWDSPNGWAPLHLIAIEGLRNYGYHGLANEIKRRWIQTNEAIFAKEHKLVEKYNVTKGQIGGGGEYAPQDGFGWTNGVLAVLLDESKK